MKDDGDRKPTLYRDRRPGLTSAEVRAAERLAESRPGLSSAEARNAAAAGKRQTAETGWEMLNRVLFGGPRVRNRTLGKMFQIRGGRK